eukprot:GHVU01127948.1.p2 GENE.GHVU01127948.1~~GHVU01127948.1.p2  ORF type:complete len:149 (+),score=33.65 GHVU01127948.1:265-711(+)
MHIPPTLFAVNLAHLLVYELPRKRMHEDEADRVSFELLCDANYTTRGALEFIDALKIAADENKETVAQIFATHPTFEARMEHLRALADDAATAESGKSSAFDKKQAAAIDRVVGRWATRARENRKALQEPMQEGGRPGTAASASVAGG